MICISFVACALAGAGCTTESSDNNAGTGALAGAGDFRAQAERVFGNLRIALASAGATFSDVVKMTTYITSVANVATLREVRTKYLDPARTPANTLIPVATLARPDLLLEIEAVAVLRK
jgi:enamine deaminase RidA (YjgF/YER057c/UK114 family)